MLIMLNLGQLIYRHFAFDTIFVYKVVAIIDRGYELLYEIKHEDWFYNERATIEIKEQEGAFIFSKVLDNDESGQLEYRHRSGHYRIDKIDAIKDSYQAYINRVKEEKQRALNNIEESEMTIKRYSELLK